MPTESNGSSEARKPSGQPVPPKYHRQVGNIEPMPRSGPYPRTLYAGIGTPFLTWSFHSN